MLLQFVQELEEEASVRQLFHSCLLEKLKKQLSNSSTDAGDNQVSDTRDLEAAQLEHLYGWAAGVIRNQLVLVKPAECWQYVQVKHGFAQTASTSAPALSTKAHHPAVPDQLRALSMTRASSTYGLRDLLQAVAKAACLKPLELQRAFDDVVSSHPQLLENRQLVSSAWQDYMLGLGPSSTSGRSAILVLSKGQWRRSTVQHLLSFLKMLLT